MRESKKDWTPYWHHKKVENQIEAWILMKDPLVAEESGIGLSRVTIDGETVIGPGPTSSRITVVDYDGTYNKLFTSTQPKQERGNTTYLKRSAFDTNAHFPIPSRQDKEARKFRNEKFIVDLTEKDVADIEADLYFHQVNVWATVHRTMDMLEDPKILGHRIPWAFKGGRLKILPHAFYDQNAHYDRSCGAICFGYYKSTKKDKKTEKLAFTCLSHDIITHELGHAMLDGLKPYYSEFTSAQCGAFHEYFGDAIAITSMLSQHQLIYQVACKSNSVDDPNNFFANVAKELGRGADRSANFLRNANNNKTVKELSQEQKYSEHEYSQILSGAYYKLLKATYADQLKRIQAANHEKYGTKTRTKNQEKSDRFKALYKAADVVGRMMLRAVDYCPPVDLSFADYARAVYYADKTTHPDNPTYRTFWMEICLERNIIDSEEEILVPAIKLTNSSFRHLDIEKLSSSKTDAYDFVDANRDILNVPEEANFDVINLYRTNKISSDDFRVQEIVIEFAWVYGVKYQADFGPLNDTFARLLCGGTLVFSREGNLLHYASKPQPENPAAKPKTKTGPHRKYLTADREQEFMTYSRFLYKNGYIEVGGSEKGMASQQSKLIASVEDGRVTFTKNPAMRCHSVPQQKEQAQDAK